MFGCQKTQNYFLKIKDIRRKRQILKDSIFLQNPRFELDVFIIVEENGLKKNIVIISACRFDIKYINNIKWIWCAKKMLGTC